MKLTKSQLKQIILEELKEVLPHSGIPDANKNAPPSNETKIEIDYLNKKYNRNKNEIQKHLVYQIGNLIQFHGGLQSAGASDEFKAVHDVARHLQIAIPDEAYGM